MAVAAVFKAQILDTGTGNLFGKGDDSVQSKEQHCYNSCILFRIHVAALTYLQLP